jgi:hypothetical protein
MPRADEWAMNLVRHVRANTCLALVLLGCNHLEMPAAASIATEPETASESDETRAGRSDRYKALANSPMFEGRPTPETSVRLKDELLFQRAMQTYLWALPLLNTMGMKVASEKAFGAGYNVLPVWKKRLDAKTQITTPNSDVIYAMGYLDVGRDGPMVLEVPAGLQGILLDVWQRPIPGPVLAGRQFSGDVGYFGPDQGKGGKYLILPPSFDAVIPSGHFPFHSATNNVFVFLRSFYQDANNLRPAVDLMESVRVRPLNANSDVRPMVFPDGSGVALNMLPVSDARAFDQLKQLVDSEGNEFVDPDWRGMLAAFGIIKGQPFTPNAATRTLLYRAAKSGYKTSRVIGFQEVVADRSLRVYPDLHWVNPISDGTPANPGGSLDLEWHRKNGGYLDLDTRIWFFTNYYSVSPGMISQVPGKGAMYMISFTDREGIALSGGSSYRIKLPPNIPIANFWSVTLYDAENGSGLANGQAFPSLGSRDYPKQNADGSTDIYLSPKPTEGARANWLATVPGSGYFAILRLYSPTDAALDKSWKPSDIEKVQ